MTRILSRKYRLIFVAFFLLFFQRFLSSEKSNYAVLNFRGMNVSDADANVISEFIRNAIVNKGITVVDRGNMEMILAEQGFQQTGCTDQACATKIGHILNVNKVIAGTYSKMSGAYFITANIIDVETAKIISPHSTSKCNGSELIENLKGSPKSQTFSRY